MSLLHSGGGLVLSKAVSKWKGIAIYSPIINGVGGNLVAVQASRISTSLHAAGQPGRTLYYNGPIASFFSSSEPVLTYSGFSLRETDVCYDSHSYNSFNSLGSVEHICTLLFRTFGVHSAYMGT